MSKIIGKDSPLRHLPDGLVPRHQYLLDGIIHAAETIDLSYARLFAQLETISQRREEGEWEIPFAPLFADVWSFVYAGSMLEKLVPMLPGARDLPQIRIFLKQIECVVKVRNDVQHIQHLVDKFVKSKEHIFGSITWSSAESARPSRIRSHVIRAGTLFREDSIPFDIPFGEAIMPPVFSIKLHAYAEKIQLATVYNGVRQLVATLESQLHKQFAHLPASGGGGLYASIDVAPSDALSEVSGDPAEGRKGSTKAGRRVLNKKDRRKKRRK